MFFPTMFPMIFILFVDTQPDNMGCCNSTNPFRLMQTANFGLIKLLIPENVGKPKKNPWNKFFQSGPKKRGRWRWRWHFGVLLRFEVPMPWLPFFSNCVGFCGWTDGWKLLFGESQWFFLGMYKITVGLISLEGLGFGEGEISPQHSLVLIDIPSLKLKTHIPPWK